MKSRIPAQNPESCVAAQPATRLVLNKPEGKPARDDPYADCIFPPLERAPRSKAELSDGRGRASRSDRHITRPPEVGATFFAALFLPPRSGLVQPGARANAAAWPLGVVQLCRGRVAQLRRSAEKDLHTPHFTTLCVCHEAHEHSSRRCPRHQGPQTYRAKNPKGSRPPCVVAAG